MDPITIIGTAGAVANIIEVISKTISSLRDLHDRWRDADFTILNLITQLTSLRAALDKISEWISSDLAGSPQHHQLVIDLQDSITCCTMLAKTMDAQLSKFAWTGDSTLDLGSRIRVVFEDKACKDFQTFIDRQTSALTLLLIACNCKTASEQKILLEKRNNREIFDKVKDSSSSLFVLHDAASRCSGWTTSTGNSSKISRNFPFDTELMGSKVYQRVLWSLFKRSIRTKAEDVKSVKQQLNTHNVEEERNQMATFPETSGTPSNEPRRLYKAVHLYLFTRPNGEKNVIMKEVEAFNKPFYVASQLQVYREIIFDTVIEVLSTFLRPLQERGVGQWNKIGRKHVATVLRQPTPCHGINWELEDAIRSLWSSRDTFLPSFESTDKISLQINQAFYFLESIHRIAEPEYVPTYSDFQNLPPHRKKVYESTLSKDKWTIRIPEPSSQQAMQRKLMHDEQTAEAMIFVADIACYDSEYTGLHLTDTVKYFEEVVHSHLSKNSRIILLLDKFKEFEKKLSESPLNKHYPDYTGGTNADMAVEYILRLFLKVNCWGSKVYPFLVNLLHNSVRDHIGTISFLHCNRPFSQVPLSTIRSSGSGRREL